MLTVSKEVGVALVLGMIEDMEHLNSSEHEHNFQLCQSLCQNMVLRHDVHVQVRRLSQIDLLIRFFKLASSFVKVTNG